MANLEFNSTNFDFYAAVPEKLQELELYPKLQALMNHIVRGYAKEFEDVKYKYRGPDIVNADVVSEIINELGFQYVTGIMSTINNTEFNSLLDFISLLNLLKGSRTGMELILRLLGFQSDIKEWWQANPKADPLTYEIVITMDANLVPDVFATIEKVKIFSRAYVYAFVNNVDFRFSLSFAQRNLTVFGFANPTYVIPITGRI